METNSGNYRFHEYCGSIMLVGIGGCLDFYKFMYVGLYTEKFRFAVFDL